MLVRLLFATALLVPAGQAAAASTVGDMLFGTRRSTAEDGVKVSGKYRSADRMRAAAYGGPFAGEAVARAVLTRLAEMARDRGSTRFAVLKQRCWQNMTNYVPGTNDCWAEAMMLQAGQEPPDGTDGARIFDVSALLPAP